MNIHCAITAGVMTEIVMNYYPGVRMLSASGRLEEMGVFEGELSKYGNGEVIR